MARLPRLTLPGLSHHVIVRGNNRQQVFLDDQDRRVFLDFLAEAAQREQLLVHAFVLMDNHVHLLVTPEAEAAMSRTVQALGRRYVRYFNQRHQRTGTLWEGRYKSSLIQTDRYFMICMAYIDLNPVRAGMVARAADYAWSSHGHYIGRQTLRWLVPHALYWALGNTPFEREHEYAKWVAQGVASRQVRALTKATLNGWPLGDEDFTRDLRHQVSRPVAPRRAGRRAKSHSELKSGSDPD
jgi:Transposase and inactivated derivatives